jgi:hypothetical protein
MFNPSSIWTRDEREQIIQSLEEALSDLKSSQRPTPENLYSAADLEERIGFLKGMPANFLEANRAAILNGKKLVNGSVVDG